MIRVERVSKLAATLLVALYTALASAQSVQYTATDLGTLGVTSDFSAPTGINSYGQVTGYADGTVPGTGYAFLWTAPGPMVNLGALGSQPIQSNANSINDSSWVVGESDSEAFFYTPQSGMQGLGFLSSGTFSVAYSINNAGTAVGGATTIGGSFSNAFVWNPSNGIRDLNSTIINPPSGWTPTGATLINNNALIAGIGYANISTSPPSGAEHAFVLSGSALTEIPDPGVRIFPEAINSSGEVVGEFYDANQQEHAFVYNAAYGTRDIGNLGGDLAIAYGVNDLGAVVGGSELADGTFAAFLYTNSGGMVNLNTLTSMPNGWTLAGASAINDQGQIAADGTDGKGDAHALLLTPTPEPSTFALLLAFGCFTLILHLCRRRLKNLDAVALANALCAAHRFCRMCSARHDRYPKTGGRSERVLPKG